MTTRPCQGHGCDRQTTNQLCTACVRRTERYISELPALALDAQLTVARQGVTGGNGHAKKGDERPLPMALLKEDALSARLDEHVALLLEWADHVASVQCVAGLPARTSGRDTVAAVRLASNVLLGSAATFLRTDAQAADLAAAVWHVRAQLLRAVDRPAERVHVGRCNARVAFEPVEVDGVLSIVPGETVCGADLWAVVGSPTARCRYCDTEHAVAVAEVARRGERLAQLEEMLGTLDQVAAATRALTGIEPNRKTITQWRRRGQLRPQPGPWAAVQLFRGGDFLLLAKDSEPRTGPPRHDLTA